MFSISGRRRPAIDMITQYPPVEPTATERELAALRAAVDELTLDALRHHRDTDLAMDLRRAAGLAMPNWSVPVIPGRDQ